MKIEKVNLNKQSSGLEKGISSHIQRANLSDVLNDSVDISSKPSFTGSKVDMIKLVPGSKTLEKFAKFENLQGEIGGIILTAVGTGLVAPISIAFNPFMKAPKGASDEEKKKVSDTKCYTAMRQPISAAIALGCQGPIQKYIDKFLDRMVNEKDCSKNYSMFMDQSEMNTKSYIESKVTSDLKAQGKTKPSYFQVLTKGFSKVYDERKQFEDLVKSQVSAEEEKQLNAVIDRFKETGKITIGERNLDNKSLAEIINHLVDDYIGDAEKLKIDAKGRAFYVDRAEVLMSNEEHLNNIFKDAGRFGDTETGYKQLDTYLKDLLKNEKSQDVKVLIQEVIDCPDDLRASRMNNTLERIKSIKELCGEKGFTKANYHDVLLERNKTLDRINTKLKLIQQKNNPVSATEESIKKVVTDLKEACRFDGKNKHLKSILHDTFTFDSDGAKLTDKIAKDIVKGYKDLVAHKFKAYGQATKIFVGVFTMILSCDILNWVYPRFMDLFFPKLSGAKKASDEAKNGGEG